MTHSAVAPLAAGGWRRRMNQVIVLAAAAAVAHALVTHFTAEEHVKALVAGDAMPAFSLPLRGGGTVTDKDGLGAPRLYFFYASWCPCSHQSVEKIMRAVDGHRGAGLTALFVGIQDSTEQLEMFLRKHKLDVPAVVEGGQSLADSVGVGITPTTLFVDKEGVIRSVFVGKIEEYGQIAGGLESVAGPAGAAAP